MKGFVNRIVREWRGPARSSLLLLCIALLTALPVYAQSHRPASATPPATNKSQDRFVTVQETALHFVAAGSGTAVVMVHGNAGDLLDFEYCTEALSASNFQVLAFDRPGHGSSELPKKGRATVEEQAAMLHEALVALGIRKAIVVGHSWGAAVALAYGLKYPGETAGMVLLSPVAYAGGKQDSAFSLILQTPVLGDIAAAMAKPFIARMALSKDLKKAFYPGPVPPQYQKRAERSWLGRKQLKAFAQDDLTLEASLRRLSNRYRAIKAPVVIVTGGKDQLLAVQEDAFRLRREIPTAELLVIENGGHEIPQMYPAEVVRAVKLISDLQPRDEQASQSSVTVQ